jgi:hypothetical protein
MKTSAAKQAREQIKLPLLDLAASAAIPADKQQELARALMELLLNAAQVFPKRHKSAVIRNFQSRPNYFPLRKSSTACNIS